MIGLCFGTYIYTVFLLRIEDPLGNFNHFSLENFVNVIKTINKTTFLNVCFLARIVLHFLTNYCKKHFIYHKNSYPSLLFTKQLLKSTNS